jgi:FkbH-like protein
VSGLNDWPLDVAAMARNAKRLARELGGQTGLRDIRIAVLSGSTADEIILFLELMLLERGFRPSFWQSEYNKYWEDAVFGNPELAGFAPDLVYVHTTIRNISNLPTPDAPARGHEASRFAEIWDGLQRHSCAVMQNNFEFPDARVLGNLDASNCCGVVRHINELNRSLLEESLRRPWVIVHDINYLAAQVGLSRWHDPDRWFSYKIAISQDASAAVAQNLAALISARYGQSKKVLVLDLDNTLWGGVIGDDGPDHIIIGRETPQAEAYTAFQEYCRELKVRGIVLAVCSKNDDRTARAGFAHPDSVLKITDFSAFKANWSPKHENLVEIAHELNLGLDSFVFVDDNPAERALVKAQLPMVSVPEIGSDVGAFVRILDRQRYFETQSLSPEDFQRSDQYAANAKRNELRAVFETYDQYLASLEMRADAGPFIPAYMDRIAQLTNKTNQFNLTTRRYSLAELNELAADHSYITRYIRLRDKFGDNGLISVLIGQKTGAIVDIHLWLMSCRVLKRDVELLALDLFADAARRLGARSLRGNYIRTSRNDMVSRHYERLGFEALKSHENRSTWLLNLDSYMERNRNIQIDDVTRDFAAPECGVS